MTAGELETFPGQDQAHRAQPDLTAGGLQLPLASSAMARRLSSAIGIDDRSASSTAQSDRRNSAASARGVDLALRSRPGSSCPYVRPRMSQTDNLKPACPPTALQRGDRGASLSAGSGGRPPRCVRATTSSTARWAAPSPPSTWARAASRAVSAPPRITPRDQTAPARDLSLARWRWSGDSGRWSASCRTHSSRRGSGEAETPLAVRTTVLYASRELY